MKTIYLIHGWGGSGSGGWFDWLKKKLKGKAKVIAFYMPNTDTPKIKEWVGLLEEKIKHVDKNTFFVTHSVGCQAVLRFLEKLGAGKKIGGCCFVAGWFTLKQDVLKQEGQEVFEIAKPWIETPIDFEKVKSHCSNFLVILSDNDPYVPLLNKEVFKDKL
jgi:predicted alpha/beta hydrolase family esterase